MGTTQRYYIWDNLRSGDNLNLLHGEGGGDLGDSRGVRKPPGCKSENGTEKVRVKGGELKYFIAKNRMIWC